MRRDSKLNRLISKSKRGEEGAGALLPILVVGIIMVILSASVALAVSYSSNISTAQIKRIATTSSVTSLINSFESDIYASNLNGGSANPLPTATIAGVGSYKVYYSTATTAPTSTTGSGVTALPSGSTIPTTAKWILVSATPQGGTAKNAVFSYAPRGSAVFDSAVNWTGSVTFSSSSTIQGSQGVAGPISVVGRESSSSATAQKLYLSVSSVTSADVWSIYSTAKTSFLSSTLRGNLVSKSAINYSSSPKIFGDVSTSAAGSQTSGTVAQEGTTRSSVASLPPAPGQQALKASLPTTAVVTLKASDCSTPALLKAKLEGLTADTTVKSVDLCAASSWATSIKPQANLILDSASTTANLAISGLTVSGPKNVSIHSPFGLTLDTVKYTNGAKGQFLSGGAGVSKITSSNLTGAVGNYGTGGGSIELASTNLYYSPVASNLCTNATTSTGCTAISSTVPHLIRVS